MTDVLTPTPLGFTSPLLDTLSSTRTLLTTFTSHHKSTLLSISQMSAADKSQMETAVEEFKQRLNDIEGNNGTIKVANDAKRNELVKKEAEISELEEKVRSEGGSHISLLESEELTAKSLATSAAAARKSSESSKSTSLNLLTKSIVSYREGLSLDFERAAGNRLRLVFTNLDPQNVDRIFAFTINVNDKEEYEIEDLSDDIDVKDLVESVNVDNDFGGFVRGVRNAFKMAC
ncbi:hypothetical protein TrST_g10642 [Triparma strigata]|uniref:Kinetochore protein SPC25 n=1 Tax=Triparma strigata TaxID=1606541 RepID=A0A9W7EKZ0_9STRA|nr:hypothetical protein TrST_g10642 [Triparma strigata]